MHDAGTDCLLVRDGDRLVGIFTDRDAVVKVAGKGVTGASVREFMTPDPVVLRPDDRLAVAIHKMAVGGFRHVPVVDAGGRPTAVVVGGRRVPAHRQRPRVSDAAPSGRVGIAVLADDLIWATRLADGVRRAGGEPVAGPDRWRRSARRCPTVGGCIVDLTARAYDGIEAVSTRAGRRASRRSPWASTTTRTRDARPRPRARRGSTPTARCSSTATGCSRPGSRRSTRPRSPSDDAAPSPPNGTRSGSPPRASGAAAAGLDALLIGVGAELRYLTGYLAMPLERLTLLVMPAADGRAGDADRPAARGDAGPDLRRGRRRRRDGHDLGGDRGPDAPRGGDPRGGARSPGRRRRRRSPCRTGCAPRSCSGCSGCCPGARFSLASAVLRAHADAQGPGRGRAAAAGRPCRRPGRSPRSPAGRWSVAPRPTSRARSASGCSPRATRSPSSGSSRRGPTAPRRTTSRASG